MNLPNPKPRERYVTDEEYMAVHSAAVPMVRHIMDIALITAMRQGDILDLERSQWTTDGFTVKPGKTAHLDCRKAIVFPA